MKRLDTNIGALDGALQETPEFLQAVSVDGAINIGFRMVNDLVRVLIKALVGLQRILVYLGAGFNCLAHFFLKLTLLARANYRCFHLSRLTIKQARYNRLAFWPVSVDFLFALIGVHVPRLPQ